MDPSDPFNPQKPSTGYQNDLDYDNIDGVDGRQKAKRTVIIMGREYDHDLLISKAFYLCFFSAFGSLFPLIAVYFKQLGMSAAQAGLLIGIRPFVEFASSPFWGSFADKFRKGKILLLFSLGCWIVFTLAIGFVEPGTPYCLKVYKNKTGSYKILDVAAKTVKGGLTGQVINVATGGGRRKRLAKNDQELTTDEDVDLINVGDVKDHTPGIAPELITKERVANYDPTKEGVLVSPPFSSRVYREPAVEQVFMLLLLLVVLGEFFSAPAVTLADACTLSYLEDQPQLFGKQRMFGSIGWAFAMFVMGIGLDYSNTFANHPCPVKKNTTEKNYTLCFASFSVFMAAAMAVATQFRFPNDQQRPDEVPAMIMDTRIGEVDPAVAENARARGPEAQETAVGPNWLSTLKTFASPHYGAFFFAVCVMGFGTGLVFAFLFWHLQEFGGSPALFGIISIINHASEIVGHFFAFRLINQFGHVKVLYMGLGANVIRYLAYSLLQNAYLVLPFQCVQGATHAIVWASATSYISLAAPPTQKASAQAILQVFFQGIGKGSGALIGGAIIASTGTVFMFQLYAFICLIVLGLFFAANRFFKVEGIKYRPGAFEDDGLGALAPQGIPMAYVPEENVVEKFGRSAINANYGATEATRDATQDAYDRYVQEPYAKQAVRFETLPTLPR